LYNTLARFIVAKLRIEENDSDKKEICEYGLEILIAYIFYFVFFIMLSVITSTFLESIAFLIGFMLLRNFAGGFHANTYLKCHLIFGINHILFIALIYFVPTDLYIAINIPVSIMCVGLILMLAPIDHKNRRFTKGEYKYFRTASVICACFVILLGPLSIILVFCRAWSFYFLLGFASATCSLVAGKIQARLERDIKHDALDK